MRNYLIVAAFLILILTSLSFAQDTCSIQTVCTLGNETVMNPSQNETNNSICIYFFYGNGCPHCANIEPFIQEMAAKYPVQVKPFEIYYNSTSQEMFRDFIQRYGISMDGIPAIFIGDRAFIGEDSIRNNLEDSIKYFMINTPVCPETYNKIEGSVHDVSPGQKFELTIPSIIIAAFIDSINPCAFAVMIFLLLYLTSLGNRKKMFLVGLVYIASVFVVYFLSGLGIFAIIQKTGLTGIVYTISAMIAIAAGLINIKDFFWHGKGISLSIPESKKPVINKYVKQATIPAAIILGILVSMFELPCTGGIYLAILGLLSSKMTLVAGIPYLILYNIIFVLPLFLILFAIYFGVSPKKAENWRKGKRKWMRLAMGLLMIILGVVMLLGMI